MKRYITSAITLLLLLVVLVLPAAASKPVAVAGGANVDLLWDKVWEVGNRCFATGEALLTLTGDFDGVGVHEFCSVMHGKCPECTMEAVLRLCPVPFLDRKGTGQC